MFHYGRPGGEFRLEIDVPDIPGLPFPAGKTPKPLAELGVNLRLSI